ncbi:glycoside hydrolase family 32 protein [Rosenbergiella australiborealis]|uniref:Sucrose-6-phosphate hydrolase n=1 Tax=Rosenbergiella australiborealis TaxID=1544696 RepID=A0ABS5T327_9GAMM|nr:glycoside hydrolase family 32 protein [Rosenbergiella australiborealis]MBT0726552.1 glycoside hydrolase family 32 protein [Rosenbergiella australiborealis]
MNSLKQGQQALTRLQEKRGNHYYPHFHLAPPAGWMNDPNGLIYFNQRYHAFYQHHPFSTDWGPMHWGHATSDDMVHWQHQPIALAPDCEADSDGCFSGSAVVVGEQLALIYTGHRWLGEVGDDSQICEVQCLALSQDGLTFEKQGVILMPPAGVMHFRDPKVWFEAGSWWMVVGARNAQQQGQVLLYKGESLTSWVFDRILAQAASGEGYMWECPDFFKLGDHRYLMCSPQGMVAQGDRFNNLFQSGVFAGQWSPGEAFIRQQGFQELDRGHDFYAPQSFLAADGRRIVMAWMDMWESKMPTKQEGWCGSFTLPRELTEENGRLRQRPVRELQALRGTQKTIIAPTIYQDYPLANWVDPFEIIIAWGDLTNISSSEVGIKIGSGVKMSYHVADRTLSLRRDYPALGIQDERRVSLDDAHSLQWHIYIDSSSIELFINDGETVLSSRIYPDEVDCAIALYSLNLPTVIDALHWWPLRSATE